MFSRYQFFPNPSQNVIGQKGDGKHVDGPKLNGQAVDEQNIQ